MLTCIPTGLSPSCKLSALGVEREEEEVELDEIEVSLLELESSPPGESALVEVYPGECFIESKGEPEVFLLLEGEPVGEFVKVTRPAGLRHNRNPH